MEIGKHELNVHQSIWNFDSQSAQDYEKLIRNQVRLSIYYELETQLIQLYHLV